MSDEQSQAEISSISPRSRSRPDLPEPEFAECGLETLKTSTQLREGRVDGVPVNFDNGVCGQRRQRDCVHIELHIPPLCRTHAGGAGNYRRFGTRMPVPFETAGIDADGIGVTCKGSRWDTIAGILGKADIERSK
ncbi:MAG TPA: hypothetical protein VHI13_18120 [Candidatus Kapabacteria bacterium]|nr:hypothetical protein [Candidatus Kapabacteria bacterium]